MGFHGGVGKSIALALKNQQVAMVYQSVNDRTCQLFIIKNAVPFAEFQVGGDDHAPFLIAF